MYEIKDSVLAVTAGTQALCMQDIRTRACVQLTAVRPVLSLRETGGQLEYEMAGGVHVRVWLDTDHALLMQVSAPEDMPHALPHPFVCRPEAGQRLLLTIDEGICLRTEEPDTLLCVPRPCCGRECTMPFTAILLPQHYLMTVLDTEWDAQLQLRRSADGLLYDTVDWLPSLGQWRYARRLRYYFAPGRTTAVCKQFRQYRTRQGLLTTLRKKQAQDPDVDRLVGAANVWLWHDDYEQLMYANAQKDVDIDSTKEIARIAAQMQAAGMTRIIWGIFFGADAKCVPLLQEQYGYLCSRYDCLTDVPPADVLRVVPQNRIENCGYTVRRIKDYPDGVAYDENLQPRPAWALPGTDGHMHPQNKLCPSRMPVRLREELPDCRREDGCRARFIDVMGVETYECFHPAHPVSRRESVGLRQQCFQYAQQEGLIVGTEDGFDRLAPFLHYNEGMMSPVFFRYQYENSGRMKAVCHGAEAAAFFDRYLLNPAYRVPLWELVYHDCVASYWYWGDSSSCCPDRMHRRDLWNILYGTAPMYSFRNSSWERLRQSIFASYQAVCSAARQVGYCEMTEFTWLREDASVQQTTFSNGTVVIVNFSDTPYVHCGITVPPDGYRIIQAEQPKKEEAYAVE